jgi:hypothetical protein
MTQSIALIVPYTQTKLHILSTKYYPGDLGNSMLYNICSQISSQMPFTF